MTSTESSISVFGFTTWHWSPQKPLETFPSWHLATTLILFFTFRAPAWLRILYMLNFFTGWAVGFHVSLSFLSHSGLTFVPSVCCFVKLPTLQPVLIPISKAWRSFLLSQTRRKVLLTEKQNIEGFIVYLTIYVQYNLCQIYSLKWQM